jgi:hypothetical protein
MRTTHRRVWVWSQSVASMCQAYTLAPASSQSASGKWSEVCTGTSWGMAQPAVPTRPSAPRAYSPECVEGNSLLKKSL